MTAQLRATCIGSISIFLWGTLALLTALTEGRIPALQLMAMTFAIAFGLMCLRWWRQGHSGLRHLRQPQGHRTVVPQHNRRMFEYQPTQHGIPFFSKSKAQIA